MQIDAKLNLVLPVCWREVELPHPTEPDQKVSSLEPTAWAHHIPISSAVFEANYRIIIGARKEVDEGGRAAARIATLALRNAARSLGLEDSAANALLVEIRRLTSIIAPTPQGYAPMMVDLALSQGVLSAAEWKEAESNLVFFTCFYSLATSARQARLASSAASVLLGSTTSLTPTEYAASLKTSTASAISAESEPS